VASTIAGKCLWLFWEKPRTENNILDQGWATLLAALQAILETS